MNKSIPLLMVLVLFFAGCQKDPLDLLPADIRPLPDGIYGRMITSQGSILLALYYRRAPLTVANFIGLAQGKLKNKAKAEGIPYYDGSLFHRVVPGFVIQSGAPGSGKDGPGYQIPNEIHPELTHDGPGILGMANSGPHTNGSQFYITHRATPHLDGGYTVFGRVITGMDTVLKISQKDFIKEIKIYKKGKSARQFKVNQPTFSTLLEEARHRVKLVQRAAGEKVQQISRSLLKIVQDRAPGFTTTASGLKYLVTQQGTGQKPFPGTTFKVHYVGLLTNGRVIGSSYLQGSPYVFRISQRTLKAWKEVLLSMQEGEKRILVVPPALGYGEEGSKEVPPGSTLIYELELLYFRKYQLK